MTTDAATDEHVDLDVDLDKAVPCQSKRGCLSEATQRAIHRHTAGGEVCHAVFFCDTHTARYKTWLALPGTNLCLAHDAEVSVTFHPLHPGRR